MFSSKMIFSQKQGWHSPHSKCRLPLLEISVQAEIYFLGRTENQTRSVCPTAGSHAFLWISLSFYFREVCEAWGQETGSSHGHIFLCGLHPPKSGLRGGVSQHFLLWLFTHHQTSHHCKCLQFSSVQSLGSVRLFATP